MAVLKVLVLVLLAGTACSAFSSRIVGGDAATIDRYPSLVQVENLGTYTSIWEQRCAGTILNSLYILSASRCFEGTFPTPYEPHFRRIRAGATYRNTGGVVIVVAQEFNHPNRVGNDGDISVVRLQSHFTFSSVIQPGVIISQDYVLPDNIPVVHVGWGSTSHLGPSSEQLLDMTVLTINQEICAERHNLAFPPRTITERMICSGILNEDKNFCDGDFGGPLYFGDIVIGVASWGVNCSDSFWPGVSTRVASYTQWIVDTAV